MTKRERDGALSELTARILSTMLDEIVMDVVLQSHQEIARSRTVCSKCHTRCGSVHVPDPSNPFPSSQTGASSSTRPSPPNGPEVNGDFGSSGTGTSTPVNGRDGTAYFDCPVCSRQVASNRYAPHLSGCLGLGGTRRGAPRNANAKLKLAPEAGRSASPYLPSENGHLSDDGKGKAKGKSKAKRTDEAEFSLNRKRNGSPSVSPVKKSKKQKTSASPVVRVKSDDASPTLNHLVPLAPSHSHSKLPSKLREMSTASSKYKEKRSSSPDSRISSPPHSASTPTSTFSTRSPTIQAALPPSKAAKPKKKLGRPPVNGAPSAPVKRPSPPRPPPPPPPPPPVLRMPEPDYLVGLDVDVDGDETGSSTDTDSD